MEREDVIRRVRSSGLIAILRHTEASLANDTASALLDAGVDVVEVTLNTRGALEMLGAISQTFGERLVVGAGTVMSAEAVDEAVAAGARLIVCPHLDESIVRRAVERGVAVVPGGFTPTEIVRAWNAGASFVKVFPSGSVGPRYIKDVLAPLNHIPLVPTGGVSLDNAAEFIRAGASALGLGSALVDPKLVAARRFSELTATARAFVTAVQTGRGTSS
jgi:2-dehydro-3-deoxyphosphogluconate aldolase/(4S)-4-hydroxy-2-oxoglutarate aldolase